MVRTGILIIQYETVQICSRSANRQRQLPQTCSLSSVTIRMASLSSAHPHHVPPHQPLLPHRRPESLCCLILRSSMETSFCLWYWFCLLFTFAAIFFSLQLAPSAVLQCLCQSHCERRHPSKSSARSSLQKELPSVLKPMNSWLSTCLRTPDKCSADKQTPMNGMPSFIETKAIEPSPIVRAVVV